LVERILEGGKTMTKLYDLDQIEYLTNAMYDMGIRKFPVDMEFFKFVQSIMQDGEKKYYLEKTAIRNERDVALKPIQKQIKEVYNYYDNKLLEVYKKRDEEIRNIENIIKNKIKERINQENAEGAPSPRQD